jgi:hypothetical protein
MLDPMPMSYFLSISVSQLLKFPEIPHRRHSTCLLLPQRQRLFHRLVTRVASAQGPLASEALGKVGAPVRQESCRPESLKLFPHLESWQMIGSQSHHRLERAVNPVNHA